MLHSSPRRFSTGVPVSAIRMSADSCRTARVRWVDAFLIACASSRTMTRKCLEARTSVVCWTRPVAGDQDVAGAEPLDQSTAVGAREIVQP